MGPRGGEERAHLEVLGHRELREEAAAMGVRVTAVLPGGVDTGFWRDAVTRQMPVENFLRPEQVAAAVIALLRMDDNVVPQELVLRALQDRDFAG